MKTFDQTIAYLDAEIAQQKYQVELLEQAVKVTRQEIKDGDNYQDELEYYQGCLCADFAKLQTLTKLRDFIFETPESVIYKRMVDAGELPF